MPDAPTPLDLDAIKAAIAACRTYNFGMYQADRLAHEHAPALVAEVERLRAEVAVARQHQREASLTIRSVEGLRKERDDALAEIARLTARPAPAWDDEALVGTVARALREHGGWFADLPADEMDCCARAVVAVVRAHLPVKPDREAAIEAMSAALHVTTDRIPGLNPGPVLSADCASVVVAADAVLDLWPGESRATVQAEALRDAVEKYAVTIPDALGYKVPAVTTEDLLDRADRLAAEGGDDRG